MRRDTEPRPKKGRSKQVDAAQPAQKRARTTTAEDQVDASQTESGEARAQQRYRERFGDDDVQMAAEEEATTAMTAENQRVG